MRVYLTLQKQGLPPQAQLPEQKLLRQAARLSLAQANLWTITAEKIELSLLLTNDTGIRTLNREHRGKDSATDVLSFPLWEADAPPLNWPEDAALPLGDIAISLERAEAQAREYGHRYEREVVFLFVHGMLHLLGYDHEISAAAEREMFAKQEEIMTKLGLPREETE